jgi:hypothetical protein
MKYETPKVLATVETSEVFAVAFGAPSSQSCYTPPKA